MATDWIPSAITGAAAVTASGITARLTSSTGNRARKAAHQEWIRDQRKDAYLQLVDLVEQAGYWAQSVRPMFDTNPPQPVPPLPHVDAQRAARVHAVAFGSPRVKHLMEEWNRAVQRMNGIVISIESGDGDGYALLPSAREEEHQARVALEDQVSADLQGDPVRRWIKKRRRG